MTTHHLSDRVAVREDGWQLIEKGFDPERTIPVGSNLLAGNGYLGYRGTSPEQKAGDWVALVVAGTYDQVGDLLREPCTVPNPLFVEASVEGRNLAMSSAEFSERRLLMRSGEVRGSFTHAINGGHVDVTWKRVASLADVRLIAQRWEIVTKTEVEGSLRSGIDEVVWSLNGDHLGTVSFRREGTLYLASAKTTEGIDIVVGARIAITPELTADTESQAGSFIEGTFGLVPGEEVVVETVAAIATSRDSGDPEAVVRDTLSSVGGYDEIIAHSDSAWEEVWERLDVEVGGSPIDQALLRFAAYHNRICTPVHDERLPVGARGLSCQAYQGAAFWDQEIYNLPVFLMTEPDVARGILSYRHHTLDGARRKAASLGFAGAYFAWMSGETGDELCPDIFFHDVLTGRPIRNHFNDWQMHISPDIVTAIESYVETTGDEEFLVEKGAEIIFEVARFLHSFVRYDDRNDTYHCIRLLGPDEWHENVDDNAFTNYQVKAALGYALGTREWMSREHPTQLERLVSAIDLHDSEVEAWRRIRDRIYLPVPDEQTGLIEQFRGFFELEDTTPDVVAGRLLDPAEYWGWPNGVAVPTQVSKQADVVMLLWLQPDLFDEPVTHANYEYYSRRCAHGSSLSHSAHGLVAARLDDIESAYEHFRATATIDILDSNQETVGGTFIGGIHTAACAGTYLLAVQGLGGLTLTSDGVEIRPRLPGEWTHLEYPVVWRGRRLRVRIDGQSISVLSEDAAVPVTVGDRSFEVEPGAPLTVSL